MLNVIENGMRIETPWYAIFPPRSTEKLTASAGTRAISKDDQIRESQQPHKNPEQKIYQQVENAAEERHKVSTAKEIMPSQVFTLREYDDLLFAWQTLQKHSIRHMPIVDEKNTLIGIISDRDILKAWANIASEPRRILDGLQVQSIMTTRVLTGTLDTNIRDLADAMTIRRIGAIPLLNEKRQVIGIVTRSDILKTIVHQAPIDLWS